MFFLRLLSRLSLPALLNFSVFSRFMMFRVLGYRKKTVLENLRNSFPDKSDKELKSIRREFYRRFNYHIMETLKVLTLDREELKSRIKIVNSDEYVENIRAGRSMIALASHQFNWEWALLATKVYYDHKIDAVYQKIKSPSFEKLMLDIRSSFGVDPVEKDNVLKIVRDTGAVRTVAFVADQAPPRRLKQAYWTTFLNQETGFFPSAQQLPTLTQYPVFFLHIRFIKKGYYEMEVKKLADPPYEKGETHIIDTYIKEAEKMIHEDPAGWLWTHKRWKRKKPESNE